MAGRQVARWWHSESAPALRPGAFALPLSGYMGFIPRLLPRRPGTCLPLLVFLLVALPTLPGARPLTLPAVLDQVDETSLNVLLNREALRQAIDQVALSRATFWPTVTVEAVQRRNRSAAVGPAVVQPGVSQRFDGNLALRWDLIDPVGHASYGVARTGVGVAEMDLAAARELVLATVADVFLTHRRNVERVAVYEANIERAEALLELARRQTEAGVATQIDVTRAQAQLANARQQRLQQDTLVAASALQLKRLLGYDIDEEVVLAPFVLARDRPAGSPATLAETAFERRADYLAGARRVRQSEIGVTAAKFNRLPTLSLTGSYGYATARAFDGDERNIWAAGLSLSIPVFDGQRTGALTRLARSRLRAQEARQRDLAFAIGAEVRLAWQNARSRAEQVEVAETSLALAREELRLAEIRFAQGVADNREIIEAQNRLAQASDGLVEATYLFRSSRVELARALGDVRAVLNEREG
jgi:outer membrane protein